MGFGIALGGGGTRGAAHVGVLLALHEEGLVPQSVAGTSAGAIVGGLYAAGHTPEQLKKMVYNLTQNGRLLMDFDIIGILKGVAQIMTRKELTLSGLMKGERLLEFLIKETGGISISDCSMPVVIPAVDLSSGRTIAYTNKAAGKPRILDILWRDSVILGEACSASAAVPIAFRPRKIGKYTLLDGGLTDNLPVSLLAAAGENSILAVDISESYEPPEKENILEIASHSLSIMGKRLRQCAGQGERLLLNIKLPENTNFLDFSHMTNTMRVGYEAAKHMMPVMRALLT